MLLHLGKEPIHHELFVGVTPHDILLDEDFRSHRLATRALNSCIDSLRLLVDSDELRVCLTLDLLYVFDLFLIKLIACGIGSGRIAHVLHQLHDCRRQLCIQLELTLQ